MIYSGSLHAAGDVSFIRAMLAGVDDRGGCFVPTGITPLPLPFFRNIAEMSARDVAYVVVTAMMGRDFDAERLRRLVDEWIVEDMELHRAGDRIFALEPWGGETMSQYDIIGRLQAILSRDLYDRQLISLDSVLFSPSFDDSCAAVSLAFMNVIGRSPVMLQGVGTLTEIEKRQVSDIVPYEMLYVVTCDQDSLWNLSCRAVNNGVVSDGLVIGDMNVAATVARVYCFFEAYRQLAIKEVYERILLCPDGRNQADMLAARVAVAMGLPVTLIEPTAVTDADAVITDAYDRSGYILNPRAVDRWKALDGILGDGETGVFVNPSHPAKFRSRLEPLLNRVIMLPVRLDYKDIQHVRYKRVAPSLNALKKCFTNY